MWTGVADDTFRVADDRAEDLYDERLGRGVEGKSTGNHSATCAGVFRQKRVRVAWSIRALGLVQQARSRVGGWSGAGQSASAPPRRGGSYRGRVAPPGWMDSVGVGMGGTGPVGEVGSGRPPDVSMMQTPDFGDLHDPAHLRPLDRPPVWRVFLKREVSTYPVIIREVRGQDAMQV